MNDLMIESGHCLKEEWIRNHWALIVWTLAARERTFAFALAGKYCTYSNVLRHLKYRYQIEIEKGHRSVLHKVFCGDLASSVFMILCVSQIQTTANRTRMWLTDNWYKIECGFLDSSIEALVASNRIKIGDKLKICMARKTGTQCNPLQAAAAECKLQIGRNSVRRALWHEKLGF